MNRMIVTPVPRERHALAAVIAGTIVISLACVGRGTARGHRDASQSQTLAVAPSTTRQVSVPRLIGLRQNGATCRVAAAGLRWRVGPAGRVHHSGLDCHPAGPRPLSPMAVTSQWPHAGARVRPGSVVTLSVQHIPLTPMPER
jgi:hypothetical protein